MIGDLPAFAASSLLPSGWGVIPSRSPPGARQNSHLDAVGPV